MTTSTFQAPIRYEQALQLFAGIPLSSIISIINGGIVLFVMNDVFPSAIPFYWFFALLSVILLRLVLYYSYKRVQPHATSINLWFRLFAAGSLASGCIWGLLSLLLFPPDSVLHQSFIAFVIAGMTAGAVTTLSAHWLHATLFIIPALLPLALRFFQLDSLISTAMAIMVCLYTLILLTSVLRIYNNIRQNITLRLDAGQRDQELQRFKSTLDQTMDCVFMFDTETLLFFYANQGALDQVGYRQDEILRMHPYDIKPEYSRERFLQLTKPLVDGDMPFITFETLHQHKDGHTLPVEIFLQYIHPQNEEPRFVAIVRDITERKRLDKLKDEFVSTVSHELRTPLTSLKGSLGLIVGGAVGHVDHKQLDLLTIAQHNTERLLHLINDILDIDKIESGNVDFNFVEVDLATLISKTIKDNQAYADKYQVRFLFTPPAIDTVALIDPARITQVLTNLLSNAAKFSPANSDITIRVERLNRHLRTTVSDQGPGIPPEFQPKVFDKFTQSDATDQRQHGGTGLGLAISKSIIEKHHGDIGFESQPGQGSSFYFVLPAVGE